MSEDYTKATLFSYRHFKDLDKDEKVRACYLHSVLKYLGQEPMNNTTVRERFGISVENSAMVSRVIKQSVEAGMIKPYDPTAGTKAMRYVPFWA